MAKQKQELVQIPAEIQEELTNLRGFRDLIGERWGYWVGRRRKQTEMNLKSEKERKAVREIRKEIRDNLKEYITEANIEEYEKQQKLLTDASKKVSDVQKPFRENINELGRGVRVLDTMTIPDALGELGTPIKPAYTLSQYVKQQIEIAKQKKN